MPVSICHDQQIAAPAASRFEPLPHGTKALIVDDDAGMRSYFRRLLDAEGIQWDEASEGKLALGAAYEKHHDLVLLDIDLPDISGTEILRHLRENPPCAHLKIIMFSGRVDCDEMARMLASGADDYLAKPFSIIQFRERVRAALRLKAAQDRAECLHQRMLAMNAELERNLSARNSDLVHARNALTLALATLVGHRDTETGAHLLRVQAYCRRLAEIAGTLPAFAGQIDPVFIEILACSAPLHDIGKVAVPDHVLLKAGPLVPEERTLMQSHTMVGGNTLREVAKQHPFASLFLQTAADIARHHHERYDGQGYPDRLSGENIPLSARIVAIADVYDALRSHRVYKPALPHLEAVRIMTEASEGQFDPALLKVFKRAAADFERIYNEMAG
jgi:response regulator RpfG family c-di-GMP phosphodiesterase